MTTTHAKFALCLLCALCLLSAPALSAAPDVVFENIRLNHLTAAEVAPLLGFHLRFASQAGAQPAAPLGGTLTEFVPEGVELVAAGHQSSRHLLVAGTAQAVAELRALLSLLDARPQPVRLTVAIYPAAPSERPLLGTPPPNQTFVSRVLPVGARLNFPQLPADFTPPKVEFEASDLGPELIALPPFANWPQIILGATCRVSDDTLTISLSAGLFGGSGSPETAVELAGRQNVHVNLAKGETVSFLFSRPDSDVTLLIQPDW